MLILLATSPIYVPQYTVILLTSISMHIVLTLSWAIFSGPTGYVSLASAAFFGFGIYISAILGNQLPLPVVIVIGGLASFVLALLTGGAAGNIRDTFIARTEERAAQWPAMSHWLPPLLGTPILCGITLEVLAWWLGKEPARSSEEVAGILDRFFSLTKE